MRRCCSHGRMAWVHNGHVVRVALDFAARKSRMLAHAKPASGVRCLSTCTSPLGVETRCSVAVDRELAICSADWTEPSFWRVGPVVAVRGHNPNRIACSSIVHAQVPAVPVEASRWLHGLMKWGCAFCFGHEARKHTWRYSMSQIPKLCIERRDGSADNAAQTAEPLGSTGHASGGDRSLFRHLRREHTLK